MRETTVRTVLAGVVAALLLAPAAPAPAAPAAAAVDVRFTDPRNDVQGLGESAYGPSFTPARPLSAIDLHGAHVRTSGANLVLQLELDEVFVLERQYRRSGDRRDLNVAYQTLTVNYRNSQVLLEPDATGAAFRVAFATFTSGGPDVDTGPCTRQVKVSVSRVHDLVGVVLPAGCIDPSDTVASTTFSIIVGAVQYHDRRTTVGQRTTSSSHREVGDGLYGR